MISTGTLMLAKALLTAAALLGFGFWQLRQLRRLRRQREQEREAGTRDRSAAGADRPPPDADPDRIG